VRRTAFTLWGPFIAALAVVFWVSSLSQVPGAHYFWDKFLHTTGYAGLSVLALRAFHGGFRRLRWKPALWAGVAVVLWAVSDEFHQSFVPGRDASALDVVADTVGFGLSLALFALAGARASAAGRAR